MPRYAVKVDSNHAVLKAAFEKLGCAVLDLARVGKSCPDLLVAMGCTACLVELKSRPKPLRRDAHQEDFRASWGGWADVARDMGDVERIVAQMRAIHRRQA